MCVFTKGVDHDLTGEFVDSPANKCETNDKPVAVEVVTAITCTLLVLKFAFNIVHQPDESR